MTPITSVGCVVVITPVACCTVIGNGGMRPCNRPIGIMQGEGGRHPVGCRGVTLGTIHGQPQRDVVGIQTLVVVFLVTTRTGIGCVLIVTIMTCGAVLGNGNMGPINDPIIIMLGKFCRTPTRICRMTGGTIGRKSQCTMVRIDGLIVIRQMTSRTGIGGIVVIPVMAQCTFVRYGDMSPVDDPKIIVNRK